MLELELELEHRGLPPQEARHLYLEHREHWELFHLSLDLFALSFGLGLLGQQ